MNRNSKLSLALHSLGHMAAAPERRFRSEDIATFSNTNAVVVRRVLGKLKRVGLVTSAKGHAGGWQLAKAPGSISVADVYLALGEAHYLAETNEQPSHCAIERALFTVYDEAAREAEERLVKKLGDVTIKDLAAEMRHNYPAK